MEYFYPAIYIVILKTLVQTVLFIGKYDSHGYLSFFLWLFL